MFDKKGTIDAEFPEESKQHGSCTLYFGTKVFEKEQ